MNLLQTLTNNVLTRIEYLRHDFIGFSFDINAIVSFLINLSFAIILIFLTYVIGERIFSLFDKNHKEDDSSYLLYIGIGYILISTGIGILGLFSLFTPIFIALFILFISGFVCFSHLSLKKDIFSFAHSIKKNILLLSSQRVVFLWVGLFILIAFINLINPEIREDQYHVDLPRAYLQEGTIMIPPKEDLKVSASPQLSEMFYSIGITFVSKESARYVHFVFYLLAILLFVNFSKIKQYRFAIYTPLLFASAPAVIKETSSMYTDFEWIFSFLLSIFVVLNYKKDIKNIVLSGFFTGGMIATKLWTIVISLVIFLFTLLTLERKLRSKNSIIFLLGLFAVSILWFTRSFLLTANPLFPAFSGTGFFDFIGINYGLINPLYYYNVFSPLFFLGVVLTVFYFRSNLKNLIKFDIFKLLVLLFILYLFIHYPFGRYLLGLYVIFIFFAAIGIEIFIRKFIYGKFVTNMILFVVFSYYFLNSVLVLPYSFGVADKNNYLSRILIRDNSSYYDFGKNFDKYITTKDKVAMYNFHGFYYADFNYKDVNFIADKGTSFDELKKNNITKIMIRGGDIKWFCSKMMLKNCTDNKYKLISSYLQHPFYYLYKIN